MPQIDIEINNEVGLHARPAALFVQTASRFKSDITVKKDDNSVNAKSILHILTLGVEKGTIVKVVAEGDDAEEALQAIKELNANDYGETG